MYLEENFKKVCDIDTERTEYKNFLDAAAAINWKIKKSKEPSYVFLTYAQGITFPPPKYIGETFPATKYWWGWNEQVSNDPQMIRLLSTTEPLYNYIQELIPGYLVIKSELMSTIPETVVDKFTERSRMHIDTKMLHTLCRRCHISFQNNEQSKLCVMGEYKHIPPGEIYEFNNKVPHWGINVGVKQRISLVIDIMKKDEWDNMSFDQRNSLYQDDISDKDKRPELFSRAIRNLWSG